MYSKSQNVTTLTHITEHAEQMHFNVALVTITDFNIITVINSLFISYGSEIMRTQSLVQGCRKSDTTWLNC